MVLNFQGNAGDLQRSFEKMVLDLASGSVAEIYLLALPETASMSIRMTRVWSRWTSI